MEEITKFFSYLKHHTDDIVRCGTLTTSFWALQSIGQRVTGAIGLRGTSTSPGISCLGCALTALNLIVANKVLGIVEGRNTVATKDNNKGKIVNQLIDRKDMIYKLTTGLFIYYVTDRTNFRTSFPSSSITLGAFVGPNNLYRRSVPSSSIVATDLQRKRIQELGRKYGCHQCGSKELFKLGFNQKIFIADHMPPSKFIKKLNKVWWRRLLKITVCSCGL